jgi:hypothetical protein
MRVNGRWNSEPLLIDEFPKVCHGDFPGGRRPHRTQNERIDEVKDSRRTHTNQRLLLGHTIVLCLKPSFPRRRESRGVTHRADRFASLHRLDSRLRGNDVLMVEK